MVDLPIGLWFEWTPQCLSGRQCFLSWSTVLLDLKLVNNQNVYVVCHMSLKTECLASRLNWKSVRSTSFLVNEDENFGRPIFLYCKFLPLQVLYAWPISTPKCLLMAKVYEWEIYLDSFMHGLFYTLCEWKMSPGYTCWRVWLPLLDQLARLNLAVYSLPTYGH